MLQAVPIQFWFEFASTYSYPAAMRIERIAAESQVVIDWKPFLLGPIFHEQGWNDSPFNLYPAKGRYMWRDLARICEREGIPLTRPSEFPRNGLLAARVACLAIEEPWGPEFVRRVYHANFAEDRDIAKLETIGAVLVSLDQDADALLDRAKSPENKERLRRHTEAAMSLGVFGAPTFVVGQELFWGNDRLEEAIAWYKMDSS
jgi:2-hydroxychromene-2-carboxylate isomerase